MPSGSRFALAALLALATLGVVLTPVVAAPGAPTGAHGTDGPAAVGSTTVADGSAVDAAPSLATTPVGQPQLDSDQPFRSNTTIEIQLQTNGDARIRVTLLHSNLTSDAEREEFRELADDHDTRQTVSRTLTALRRASEAASESTDRDMAIQGVDYFSSIDDRGAGNATGTLGLSVTWTNFAATEEGRLAVDDVFETPTGTWLSRLEAGQTLVITPPDGYEAVNVEGGDYREPSWHWQGPRTFSQDSHPVAVFSGDPFPWTTVAGVIAAALVAVLGIVFVVRRRSTVGGSGDDGESPAAAEATADADDGANPAAGSGGASATNGTGDDGVDVELLSDEERVERLLDQNGGRMKQASIVKETGWSNAKVSQLLSSMEEAGQIDKLRIGRENLISFPDEDVADVEE